MGEDSDRELTTDEIYHEMEVLEPYTARELASCYDVTKYCVRKLLQRLFSSGTLRKKKPNPNQAIWIRDASVHECANWGCRYEVKFHHLVLSAVQFCPRCGEQV